MGMKNRKFAIHDLLEENDFLHEAQDVINANEIIRPCIGCFGCWVKEPGQCVLKDSFSDTGKRLSQCEELIIISECVYGGFSPQVKNVMDRSISYILPFFRIRPDGMMHHQPRYKEQIHMSVYFYGKDLTEEEMDTAKQLVERNAVNLNAKAHTVSFYKDIPSLKGALK